MKKFIIILTVVLTSAVASSQGLKDNAKYIKDTYPVEYETTIKKQALSKWGDNYSMVVYEINKQSNSLVKLIDVFKSDNTNIVYKAILKWSVDGYKDSNNMVFSELKTFSFEDLLKMNCNWSMVLYEYNKQVKAKNSF